MKGARSRRFGGFFIAIPLVVLFACGSDDDDNDVVEPVFTEASCPVEIDDPGVTCGFVRLPENRSRPDGPFVDLSVARLHATGGNPDADPVLYITGGPGGSSTPILPSFLDWSIRRERDLIIFDARGTGASVPALECPEREEATWLNFSRSASAEVEILEVVGATAQCFERLRSEGIDLDQYDTPNNAADVADLRVALGIENWFLFGSSYGTTVALEVMRSYPEGIRGVILDAAYPLEEGRSATRPIDTGTRAFERLFAQCDQDPDCRDAYGDLRQLLLDTVADFDRDPYTSEIVDPFTGAMRPITLDGTDLLAGLFSALYDESLVPLLPGLFRQVADRSGVIIDQLAALGVERINGLAEGVFAAVECRDRGSEWRTDDVLDLLEQNPEFKTIYNASVVTASCEALDLGSIPRSYYEPVESNIPTIVFGGGFDPITPPRWGVEVAETLGHATSLVFDQGGHGAVYFNECSEETMLAFLRSPEAEIDPDCPGLL